MDENTKVQEEKSGTSVLKWDRQKLMVLIGSFICFVMLAVNIIYTQLTRLDEPIVVKNNVVVMVDDNYNFERLYMTYITNHGEVWDIGPFGIVGEDVSIYTSHEEVIEGRRYDYHILSLEGHFFEPLTEEFAFAELFDWTSEDIYEIGDAMVYVIDYDDEDWKNRIHMKEASSSGSGDSSYYFENDEELTLVGISASNFNEIKDDYYIEMESFGERVEEVLLQDLEFPISVKSDLRVNMRESENIELLPFQSSRIVLEFVNTRGEERFTDMHIGYYMPRATEEAVEKYVKEVLENE